MGKRWGYVYWIQAVQRDVAALRRLVLDGYERKARDREVRIEALKEAIRILNTVSTLENAKNVVFKRLNWLREKAVNERARMKRLYALRGGGGRPY